MNKARATGGTLTARLGESLRTAIVDGRFPPGTKLPSEAQLGKSHGVSRTVVREAIASLRADRLVDTRQGAGVFVLEPPQLLVPAALSLQTIDPARVSSMIEVLELRTAVEVESAGLAALRRSPLQEEVILERHYAVRACLEAGTSSSEADFALHLAIAEATNNPRFRDFLSMIGSNVIPRAALRTGDEETDQTAYLKLIDEEHRAIVFAISNGDDDGAREAMRRHLRGSQTRYRSLLRENRKAV
ncbi:GntR family transcriptional regulator [Rhizobium sp. PP-F2F-G38]|uniref:FadR family transcriptional regulator n=1 Tax=Ferranicluibacter rubi TaxID=2715133 RepID=A0AA43ZCY8_9HYPH|nr:FadR/GntR family transcriptional regulator [Ferranicluibacter rubi]PYE94454.1 GntR family transcriptional regulator [Rhizobium sp. PP-F2F-G38]TCP80383.1 GntR family transcriptional regulator [Rhizobium sp. PP-CC-2G-626]TCQ09039.1 GntR family transcriptional regulator [Rhizobium sp. PP-F2F-G36]TCQ23745.1 GntR family transcriptional regulator [Rhizobium sp. PP-CC-3G-465]NHT75520.1 FadR family transcriptional regulator [Ferranicluibacter rubi]